MDRARFNLKRPIVVMANRGDGIEYLVTANALEGLLSGHDSGVYFIKAYRAFRRGTKDEATSTFELGMTKRPLAEFFKESKAEPPESGPARYWALDNRKPVSIAISEGNVDAVEMLSPVDDPDEAAVEIDGGGNVVKKQGATS